MDTILWLFVAVCVILALLTIADHLREKHKPQNLRMVDQEQPISIIRVASLQGKAAKGVGHSDARKVDAQDEDRERARLSMVAKTGSSR